MAIRFFLFMRKFTHTNNLECESTVNTPAPSPSLVGHSLIWPKLVGAAVGWGRSLYS